MMPDASNYLQEKVLKAIAQGQSFSVANVYVGLLLTPSGAYAPGREPTDANYARQKVTLSSPKYAKDDPTCMEATNPSAVSFPVAQYAWGTLEYYALFDRGGGRQYAVQWQAANAHQSGTMGYRGYPRR